MTKAHTAQRPVTLRQCAILAGGLATRLGDIALETPKPVLTIGARPFVVWLMHELMRFGVEEFVSLTGHLPDAVERAVRDGAAGLPRPVALTFSQEPNRAGTGGALFHAAALLADRFLLCNADSLLDGNLAGLLADFSADDASVLARIAVRPVDDATRYGTVTLDGDCVTVFRDRPAADQAGAAGLINAGIYALDRRVVERLRPECSLERDLFPALAEAGALRATTVNGWFIDIGVPDDLAHARRELPSILHRAALFLDRDGVLNHDHGYVGSRDKWDWIQGALEAVKLATDHGWHVFVVTNQSGVARGLYTEDDVKALLAWMADEVRRHGGTIDDVRYCPSHPEATIRAYRRDDDWRKPGPGMILNLLADWELDPQHCVLVGDQDTDMQAARAAGIAGVMFDGVNLRDTVARIVLREDRGAAP
jgi:D-glycero-D-manno-heptose 1,7-bisphosphate phosphatase